MVKHQLASVTKTLRETATDPFRFDDLVDKWNAVFDLEDTDEPIEAHLAAAVDETFHVIADQGTSDVVDPRLRQVLNALTHASFVVRADGIVVAMNDAAIASMPFDPGDRVSDFGYWLDRGEGLPEVIAAALNRRNASDVILRRAVQDKTNRTATIAIVPTTDRQEARALVFVIDPQWRDEVKTMLGQAYELTAAETGILMAFLDGNGIKEIAKLRGTSEATVRTQFHTIMNKTGARTQAELMRNTIAVSQFFGDAEKVAEVARHPNRRRFTMPRAGGRSVDLTLSGDLSGRLVVAIADATLFTHPEPVEQAFKEAGICMAILCRPGFGSTDPPSRGQDYLTCLSEDVSAVVKQLGYEKFVLMGHNTSSVFAYGIAAQFPDGLHRLFIKSTLLPAPYLKGDRVRSPWARALMRGLHNSPRMYNVMIYSAIRAWKAMGSRRMLLMQLRGFALDTDWAKKPEVYKEYEAAMQKTLAQGTEHAVLSFEYARRDWTDCVRNCPVPIEVVRGEHDPSSDPVAIRNFCENHKSKITLNEIPGAGYLTFITHTNQMIRLLDKALG